MSHVWLDILPGMRWNHSHPCRRSGTLALQRTAKNKSIVIDHLLSLNEMINGCGSGLGISQTISIFHEILQNSPDFLLILCDENTI